MSATPQQYLGTFELLGDGQAVRNDLLERFGGPPFKAGQADLPAYNCGGKAVVEHILAMIDQAEKPAQR